MSGPMVSVEAVVRIIEEARVWGCGCSSPCPPSCDSAREERWNTCDALIGHIRAIDPKADDAVFKMRFGAYAISLDEVQP